MIPRKKIEFRACGLLFSDCPEPSFPKKEKSIEPGSLPDIVYPSGLLIGELFSYQAVSREERGNIRCTYSYDGIFRVVKNEVERQKETPYPKDKEYYVFVAELVAGKYSEQWREL